MTAKVPVIRVHNLGKKYRLGGPVEKYSTFRDTIVSSISSVFRGGIKSDLPEFWALKDVSFDIEQGDVVGIIGRNGAGKSTLLKILSRITTPTEGTVELNGRVGSLLEVGTGFHPELTGRENIFLSGSILGMKRREIEDKLDNIVRFSEIEKFLDTPVKRYSSGMYVRLAFAVAANLEAEILLVDEVLAVGDISFQKRCFSKMNSIANEGRTILLVSHNLTAVQNIAQRTLLFQDGEKVLDGTTEDAISAYINTGLADAPNLITYSESAMPGDENVRLKSIRFYTADDPNPSSISIDEGFFIEITFVVTKEIFNFHNYFRISTESGLLLFGSGDWDDPNFMKTVYAPGTYKSVCRVNGNLLNKGTFFITIIGQVPHKKYVFVEENAITIHINELHGAGGVYSASRPGLFRPILNWKTEKI